MTKQQGASFKNVRCGHFSFFYEHIEVCFSMSINKMYILQYHIVPDNINTLRNI